MSIGPGRLTRVSTDVVTGEAVAVDLRLARAGSRALAFAIDAAVVTALLVATIYILGVLIHFGDAALAVAVLLSSVVLVLVGYPVVMETTTRGRSLGKLALGLRVVRDDGGPIRFRQAFVRGLVGLFELYLFSAAPALIASLLSRRGKRIGDVLAGTVVLQERVPAPTATAIEMPPPLAGWAATADLSRVPDGLALAARQFLGRLGELTPRAAAAMESQLAAAMYAVVAPPPPPGTPGWALLAGVLAERRRREEARLGETNPAPAPPTASATAPPAQPTRDEPPSSSPFAPPT